LLLLAFSGLPLVGFAQSLLEQKVDFSVKDMPLKEAIFELSQQSKVGFTFNGAILPDKKITANYTQTDLITILSDWLVTTNVRWKIVDQQVVLYKKKVLKTYTISGYIKDEDTRERLIGANIFDAHTQKGIASNEYGFYSITLPRGEHLLNFSFLGYKAKARRINLKKNTKLTVTLKPSLTLNEVVVTSKGLGSSLATIHKNAKSIPLKIAQNLPTIGGEKDLLRTINLLAGVQSGTDGFGGMNVRGGSSDQNLILLDGVPVYNPTHLGGLFSIFNSSAIKSAQLYKGAFPARFGGRLSSVLDVRTKEGNQRKTAGEFSAGLIALNGAIEGPIVPDKSSYFFSMRRSILGTYLRPISRQVKKDKGDTGLTNHTFSDFNGKVNFYLGQKDQLFLSIYHGNDRFSDANRSTSDGADFRVVGHNQDLDWGNTIGVLRWNHLFSDRLFANTTLNFSRFWFQSEELYDERKLPTGQGETAPIPVNLFYNSYNSSIADKSAKIDFDFIPSTNHYLKFGGEFINHTFSPGAFTLDHNSDIELNHRNSIDSIIADANTVQSQEYALYVEDNITFSPKLKGNIGLRSTFINVQSTQYFSLQPRVVLKYAFDQKTVLSASVSKMMQNVHLLTTTGIGLPTDLWVPATAKVKPQLAWQGSLGFKKVLTEGLSFQSEIYYKYLKNLIAYQEGSSFLLESIVLNANNWEHKVTTGIGRNYGLELTINKATGALRGWASYTFSKARRQFEAINFGKPYNFRFDRPHSFKIAGTYQLNNKINLSASWTYESGIPTTLPTSGYTFVSSNLFSPVSVLSVSEKNSFRLPDNHHLDIGINFTFSQNRIQQTLQIGIYNVYNRKNPLYYRLRAKNDGSGENEFVQVTLFPIMPSLNYTLRF
ncbi:MAG: TonB-dependent receptor, partial [Bacteroidota bacterium]